MRVLGLIPARGGSKRVPNKNLKDLLGKPLIQYTCDIATSAFGIDKVILSSDSEDIIKYVKYTSSVEVLFRRPAEYSGDKASDYDVLKHANDFLNDLGDHYDAIIYLRPTSPLRSVKSIESAIQKLKADSSLTGVRSVTKVHGVYHPYWMYKLNGDTLESFDPRGGVEKYYQSQLLPNCYRLNGAVDILRTENLLIESKNVFGDNISFIELDEYESIDIDTPLDFELAEFFLKRKLSEKRD